MKTNNIPIILLTVFSAIIGMMAFVASVKGYFITKSKWYENIILFVSALILFMPNVLLNQFADKYVQISPHTIPQLLENKPHKTMLKLRVEGENISGDKIEKSVGITLAKEGTGIERLENTGLKLRFDPEEVRIDRVDFGSHAAEAGLYFDWTIKYAFIRSDRMAKEWIFIPALLLLGFVIYFQRRRYRSQG